MARPRSSRCWISCRSLALLRRRERDFAELPLDAEFFDLEADFEAFALEAPLAFDDERFVVLFLALFEAEPELRLRAPLVAAPFVRELARARALAGRLLLAFALGLAFFVVLRAVVFEPRAFVQT